MTWVAYEPYVPPCSGGPMPGTQNLAAALLEVWPIGYSLGIYNCLAGETLVMTPDGDFPIADLAGLTVRVLTLDTSGERSAPRWVDAPIKSYGEQPLMRVTLGRRGQRQVIHATPGHRWLTRKNGEQTTARLVAGQSVPYVQPRSGASRIVHYQAGIPHGLVYGDGSVDNTGGSRIALHGAKNLPLAAYFPNAISSYGTDEAKPYVVITGMSRQWKQLPDLAESTAYLYGFLAGWFAADGRVTKSGKVELYCTNQAALEQARVVARRIGIATTPVHAAKSGGNFVGGQWLEQREIGVLTFTGGLDSTFFLIPEHRERWNAPTRAPHSDWRVISVEPTDRVETVYCAEVEDTESFTLAEGVLTGNCRPPSIHGDGRAFDLGLPMVDGRANPLGYEVIAKLKANGEALGIQECIFDRKRWSQGHPDGVYYGGESPHYDHVHTSQNKNAATYLTYARALSLLGGLGGEGEEHHPIEDPEDEEFPVRYFRVTGVPADANVYGYTDDMWWVANPEEVGAFKTPVAVVNARQRDVIKSRVSSIGQTRASVPLSAADLAAIRALVRREATDADARTFQAWIGGQSNAEFDTAEVEAIKAIGARNGVLADLFPDA